MADTLISPELETFQNRYRWKVADCYRLKDLGFLEGRFEVIDGEVVDKMRQNPSHFYAMGQITRWANRVFGERFVRTQGPIALGGGDQVYSEPEPDLAVTTLPDSEFSARHPLSHQLCLVVEVSDTSVRTDLLVKANLYARSGISEYWVLDLNTRKLHVYRNPLDGTYTTITTHGDAESVCTEARSEEWITISDILPPVGAQPIIV